MSLDYALHLIQSAIGIAVLFQTIEMFQLRKAWADSGVWGWNQLRSEFPGFFSAFYQEKNFFALLSAQVAAALLLLYARDFSLALVALVVCVLICYRWRGTFNGGSDYVTVQVLLTLSVVGFFPQSEKVAKFALLYLSAQLILSYLIAGLVKVRHSSWRNGTTLAGLLTQSAYSVPRPIQELARNTRLMTVLSWLVILFECSFPLSLHPSLTLLYLGVGFLFHLGNYIVFGLNRFVFSWIALYPALYAVTSLQLF